MAFTLSLSYFDIVVTEKKQAILSANSQRAEAIAEAGVEQALWEYNYGSDFNTWSGTTIKTKTSSGFDPTFGEDYSASVDMTDPSNPVITSTCSYNVGNSVKQVVISCGLTAGQSLYDKAIKTKNKIDLSGNAKVDSYDSDLGVYNAVTNRTLQGDVLTNSTANPAIQLTGNSQIYGAAATGAGGTVTTGGNSNLPSGGVTTDASETINDNTVPSDLSSAAPSADLLYNRNQNITMNVSGTTNYKCDRLDISGNAKLTFTNTSGNPTVDINLYLVGSTATSFRTTGNGKVIIGSGVNLAIYADKAVRANGNAFVNNNTSQNPTSLIIYGTPTCDTVEVSGNGDIVGIINAPSATVRVNGNGDVYGAVIADKYVGSGNGDMHFDRSLLDFGGGTGAQLAWYSRSS